ncbi:MAG TPA: type 1 glutamine amidotransferase domain-containing protein [Spirochaetota bacterium]|nr:type 1 glutamine amidotransferase domain-containing protein [Spirochaetota bacterium]
MHNYIRKVLMVSMLLVSGVTAGTIYAESEDIRMKALNMLSSESVVPSISTEKILLNNETLRKLIFEDVEKQTLKGKKIAIIATDGVEELEITVPVIYLRNRGAIVDIVSPRMKEFPPQFGVEIPRQRATHIMTVHYMENASWLKFDRYLDKVSSSDYDGVIIPGGGWNPDSLRGDPDALKFVKSMDKSNKPVAAICHGPLVLVNAGIVSGRKMTSFWSVQVDLKNAGAVVSDEAVVTDRNLVTSRYPFDLPQFMSKMESLLNGGK